VSEQTPDIEVDDLPEQMQVRHSKRERLIDEGVEPYPVTFARTATIGEVRGQFPNLEVDATTGVVHSISGRVIFVRNTGKLCFATVRDGDGTEIQAMLSLDKVGEDGLANWKSLVDIGDFVGVTGEVISSRRGELSVLADSWTMVSKKSSSRRTSSARTQSKLCNLVRFTALRARSMGL